MQRIEEFAEKAILDRVRAATVRLVDTRKPQDGGSGVVLRDRGETYILTASHVVPAPRRIDVVVPAASQIPIGIEEVHWRDEESDLAVLSVNRAAGEKLAAGAISPADIRGGDAPPVEGDEVIVCGYPGALIKPIGFERCGDDASIQFNSIGSATCLTVVESVDGDGFRVSFDLDPSVETTCARSPDEFQRTTIEDLEPFGISGGGIWSVRQGASKSVWHASVELLGIVHRFRRSGRLLNCTSVSVFPSPLSAATSSSTDRG